MAKTLSQQLQGTQPTGYGAWFRSAGKAMQSQLLDLRRQWQNGELSSHTKRELWEIVTKNGITVKSSTFATWLGRRGQDG